MWAAMWILWTLINSPVISDGLERGLERVLECKSKNCIWCEPYLFWTCHPRAPFLFLICHGSSICQFHVSFHLPFSISFTCYLFSFSPSTSIFHPSASFDWSSVASSLEHSPRQHLSQLNQPPLLRHEKWLFDTFSPFQEKYGVLHIFKSARLCWLGDKYYFDTFPLCFVIIERRERNPISRHFPVASNTILVLQNPCRSDMKQWKCGEWRYLWANKAFVHLWRREALRIPEHWVGRSLTVLV